MKAQAIVLAAALSVVAPLAVAQQDHQAHHPDTAAQQSMPDTAGMPSPMVQRLDRMQAIVDQLAESKDPAQRQKLMEQHRQAMQETRSMMGGIGGAGMGNMGMMGGASGMMPMMERMEAMQGDLDQIMQMKDPAQRQERMQQHRQQMQDMMSMMRNMQQGSGMGMMNMMGGQQGMMGCGMAEAFRQMDKRLDLMQKMLEQALEYRNQR